MDKNMGNGTDRLARRRARRAELERVRRATPEYKKQYAAYRAAKSEYDRERRKTPEYKAKHAKSKKKYDSKPEVKLRRLQRERKYNGHPEPTRDRPDRCECCGGTQRYALALDHCHVTGKFRGWLCHACNLAIGSLGDSREGLLRAIAYLNRAN